MYIDLIYGTRFVWILVTPRVFFFSKLDIHIPHQCNCTPIKNEQNRLQVILVS